MLGCKPAQNASFLSIYVSAHNISPCLGIYSPVPVIVPIIVEVSVSILTVIGKLCDVALLFTGLAIAGAGHKERSPRVLLVDNGLDGVNIQLNVVLLVLIIVIISAIPVTFKTRIINLC